jgi:hypothetical protein
MQISFNDLLQKAGIAPPSVRLVRHQQDEGRSNTSYHLWMRNRSAFLEYESIQSPKRHAYFSGQYWASFVGTPTGETMFTGFSSVSFKGLNELDYFCPLAKVARPAGTVDVYKLDRIAEWESLAGRLFIDWGKSERAWIQRAHLQDKCIIKLLDQTSEPEFPGFSKFMCALSDLETLPHAWISAMRASRGIYLLTCPNTKEQYVGSAIGEDGFWGRWMSYVENNHGGNVQLKSRNKSDYQVSILEIVNFASSRDDVIALENLWKQKLQSRSMGLNSN